MRTFKKVRSRIIGNCDDFCDRVLMVSLLVFLSLCFYFPKDIQRSSEYLQSNGIWGFPEVAAIWTIAYIASASIAFVIVCLAMGILVMITIPLRND